jgi:DNA-3-methyladenine glycosylase
MAGSSPSSLIKAGRAFYEQDAARLARALIGTMLVHRYRGRTYRARIVETEAYLGPADLASHSSKGRTKRTEVMFGPPGRAYVYFIYGMHEMFNIVCGREGEAHAVLIRAAEPLNGWKANLTGPGRFARAMRIPLSYNGLDLTGDRLFILRDPEAKQTRIARSTRVGVDYAQHWKDAPLRFFEARNLAVSKVRAAPTTVR